MPQSKTVLQSFAYWVQNSKERNGAGGIKSKLKARDVGEGHQLSISAGHRDVPFLSATPQDFDSAEWALPRLPLLPSKAIATVPNLQLPQPLPHPAAWQGEGLPVHPFLLHPSREGTATGTQGHSCCQSALTAARAGPRDTEGPQRQNDPAGFRAQSEDMDLHTRGYTHGCFSNLVMVNLSW